MTKVSRRPLAAEQQKAIEKEFCKVLAKLKTARKISLFLRDLLTHTERKMLTKRLQIARLLLAKTSYKLIRKKLHVTDTTIAKVNNWLNNFGQGYRLGIKKLQR